MRDGPSFLFGIFVLGFGLSGAFLSNEWLASQGGFGAALFSERTTGAVQVVVARATLEPGEPIHALQLGTISLPANLRPVAAISSVSAAEGRVPRRLVMEGEPLLGTALLPRSQDAGGPRPGARLASIGNVDDAPGSGLDFTGMIGGLDGRDYAAPPPPARVEVVRGPDVAVRQF